MRIPQKSLKQVMTVLFVYLKIWNICWNPKGVHYRDDRYGHAQTKEVVLLRQERERERERVGRRAGEGGRGWVGGADGQAGRVMNS